ncbi:MAG: hypothetical protein Kow00117_08380 [Phototrophicales bacterium]
MKNRHAVRRVTGISFFIAVIFCGLVLINHPDGALAFAHIGTRFSEGIPKEDGGSTGYDGQFVYFIARDGAQAVPYIDGPTFRYQRIFYPVLARALSLGNAELLPWVLIAINIIALGAGTGMLAYLLTQMGMSPYLALIYTVWVGNLFALRFNLTELLCFALALWAVIAYQRERYIQVILLLVLSTLTKELGLIFAGGLALHTIVVKRQWQWSFLIGSTPFMTLMLWWFILRLWLEGSPTSYPAARGFSWIPLGGLWSVLSQPENLAQETRTVQFILAVIFLGIPAILLFSVAIYQIWRKGRQIVQQEVNNAWTLSLLLASVGFVFIMPGVSWQDPAAAYRVAAPLIIGGILFIGQFYPKWLKWLVIYWLPACLIILLIPGLWSGGA